MADVWDLAAGRGQRAVAALAASIVLVALGVGLPERPAHGATAGLVRPAVAPPTMAALLDEQAAMRQAMATGQPVEVTSLTTETVRVLADPAAGGFRAEVSAGPVRVADPTTGGWKPVDTTMVVRPDGTIGPAATPVRMSFSGGGSEPLAHISDGAHEAELGWPGALPEPVLAGSTATYQDVLVDVDLVVEAGSLGFRELLVVKSRRGAANPALRSVRFSLAGRGVTMTEHTDGGLRMVDAGGRPVFAGPPPRMWDSSGAPVAALSARYEEPAGARSAGMDLQVTGSSVTVVPDPHLLNGPDLVFPLVLDPAVSRTHGRTYWTMVWSNGLKFPNDGTEHARVGYDGWSSSPKRTRSFFRFDTSVFAGKHILSAVFAHKQVHSPNHSCSATSFGPGVQVYRTGSISSSTSWSSQPSWAQLLDTDALVHGHESYCAGYDRQEWNVEAGVEVAAAGNSATLTLGMKSANESDRDGWRKYDNDSSYPLITVRYNSNPNTPSNVKIADPASSCVTSSTSPAIINDVTPKFQATLTDPDGASAELRGRFEVYDGSALVWSSVSAAEHVSGTTVTATSTALTDGKTYGWRVRAEELIEESTDLSGWFPSSTGFCYTKIDTIKPPPPAVSSTAYPELDPDNVVAHGGVGMPGDFTLVAGATDVTAYVYQLNGGPVQSQATTGGAAATVAVMPDQFGVNVLHVHTKDAAGNQSLSYDYDFNVARGAAPVGIWTFDEATGTVAADSSGAGRDATLQGAVLAPTVGRAGGSVGVLATSYAETAAPVLDTTKSFTVSAWLRLTTDGTADYRPVLSQNGARTTGFNLYYSTASANWTFGMTTSDVDAPGGATVSGSQPVAKYVWTHLAGTYDAFHHQIRLFINGRLAGEKSFTMPWNATGGLQIGRSKSAGVFSEYFRGNIDHVYVWDRVVSIGELVDVIHVTDPNTGLPQPMLVGHWTLDETTGTVGDDATAYSKDLSLQPGATWVTDGERGNVMRLDGDATGHATAIGPIVDATGSFTITAWVKPTDVTNPGMVIAAPGAFENTYQLEMWTSSKLWGFTRHAQDGSSSAFTTAFSGEVAEFGVWTHLAAVYDAPSGRMFLYVNGVRQGDEDGVSFTTPWPTSNALRVGSGINDGVVHNAYSAEGLYDDLRVYTGVMSQQDIILLMLTS